MSPEYTPERVVIWGKTYPELSRRYAETVCTAGVRLDGTPIRLYPVPLRYLENDQQYSLWDVVDVPVTKALDDSRPESFKIQASAIQCVGHIDPDPDLWLARRDFIFRDSSWHFENVGALKAKQRETGLSLGFVAPGSIESVYLRTKGAGEEEEFNEKLSEIQSQRDLFLPEYKQLGFRRKEIRLKWRCWPRCEECSNGPHDMQVLDWGLIELARKRGWDWDAAKSRMEEITSPSYDFRLFLGNMKAHRTAFTIVGLWYPKRRAQIPLF